MSCSACERRAVSSIKKKKETEEREEEGKTVEEAIRILTASRTETRARRRSRNQAEFSLMQRFSTLDCTAARLSYREARRGKEG